MSLIFDSTYSEILNNNPVVKKFLAELNIPFTSVAGKSIDQLKMMVQNQYHTKRNELNSELEKHMRSGNQLAEKEQRDYNDDFDLRYNSFTSSLDNLEFERERIKNPGPIPEIKKNISSLVIRVILGIIAAGALYYAYSKITSLRKENIQLISKRQNMAIEQATHICDSVNALILDQKADSTEKANKSELLRREKLAQYNKDALIREYQNQIHKKDSEYRALQEVCGKQADKFKELSKTSREKGLEIDIFCRKYKVKSLDDLGKRWEEILQTCGSFRVPRNKVEISTKGTTPGGIIINNPDPKIGDPDKLSTKKNQ